MATSKNSPKTPPAPLRVRAPAKINWTLAVLGKRPDGYHDIDTVLQAISLADELAFTPKRRIGCALRCDQKSVPLNQSNLVHRAWALLRKRFPDRVGGVTVEIKKRIPVGAGLGGGSSDAAATLTALNSLFTLGLSKERLADLAAHLGSDVPFFLQRAPARCTGRGEIVEPIADRLPTTYLVLVPPGFESPTAAAYAALGVSDYTRRSQRSAAALAVRALEEGKRSLLRDALDNTFDRALTASDPRYGEVKSAMKAAGLESPLISGSGSTVFAIAPNKIAADHAAYNLRKTYPLTCVARTLRSGK